MSNIKPSLEQQKAIDAVGQNYLISAGAGSGKTAVLCERIYQLVKKERRIDNFLILTFTNLAASEMKKRIREKLAEDPDTKQFAVEVDNAHIETFDSFYLFIAKKYFYALNIPKDISIIDNAIIEIKRRELVDQIFGVLVSNNDENFIELMRCFSLKDNDNLKGIVLKILNSANNKIDKVAYYNSLENDYSGDEYVNSIIHDEYELIRKKIRYFIEIVKSAGLTNLDIEGNILDFLYSLLNEKDYFSIVNTINETSFANVAKAEGKEENKEARTALLNFYRNNFKLKYLSKEQIETAVKENNKHIKSIMPIVRRIDKELDEYKIKHNAYSFSDISRLVLKLFKDPEIVKEVKDKFDYIMVDEYQDTNDIQETVLNIISKNNVYMVGDIKQSIYKFRNADCEIFNRKFNDYKKHLGGEEIDLNKSFRSRVDVVDFINDLFSKLMVLELNPIDYSNGHNFGFGKEDYGPAKPEYKTEEIRYTYSDANEALKKETRMIINDIINKINTGYEIFDGKKMRSVDFRDFAIIIDRETEFDEFAKAISEAGLPLKSCGKDSLMTSDINVVIRNLVKLLYYSLNDQYENEYKHAFLSVARSFLVEENDQKIYETFENFEYSKVLVTPLGQKIQLIKERLRFAPLEEVVATLFKEFSLYDKVIKIGNYYANIHKAESLLKYASQMDTLGMTLSDLVNYFDNLTKLDLDIEYRDTDSQENSITLINIHQSKGLEYNIIYYPRLNKQFNTTSDKLTVSKKYGILFDINGLITKELDNYLSRSSDFEEKIRLLYVAFTRAKQKIILYLGKKETKSISYSFPYKADSFVKIYNLANLGDKYLKEYTLGDDLLELVNKEKEVYSPLNLEIKSIKVESEVKEKKHASKEVVKVDESLLRFGTEVHALLEGLDLSKKDTSYIKDYRYRKIANNIINSELFKGVTNEQVRHEFAYYDKENNVNGVIDCLIIKNNEIDIVDFKLKNIAEEDYDKQLRTYKAYISSISDKPIKMYLLAALTGEVREVKDE